MRSHPTLNHTGELKAAYWRRRMCDSSSWKVAPSSWRLEIALRQTPVANSFGHASHQGAHAAFALGRAERSMQILTGHNIGGGHRPILGNFDIFLLEDRVALGVRDQGGALLPFDFVVGRNAGLGEKAMEGEAWGLSCWLWLHLPGSRWERRWSRGRGLLFLLHQPFLISSFLVDSLFDPCFNSLFRLLFFSFSIT